MTAEPAATATTPPKRTTAQPLPCGQLTRDRTSTASSSATGHTAAPIWLASGGDQSGPCSPAASHAASTLPATDTSEPRTNPVQAKPFAPEWVVLTGSVLPRRARGVDLRSVP